MFVLPIGGVAAIIQAIVLGCFCRGNLILELFNKDVFAEQILAIHLGLLAHRENFFVLLVRTLRKD